MASNSAAWLTAANAISLEIGPAPLWTPGENEILVRNHAVAINSVDGANQRLALFPLNQPSILSHDVAGEVVAFGRSRLGGMHLGRRPVVWDHVRSYGGERAPRPTGRSDKEDH